MVMDFFLDVLFTDVSNNWRSSQLGAEMLPSDCELFGGTSFGTNGHFDLGSSSERHAGHPDFPVVFHSCGCFEGLHRNFAPVQHSHLQRRFRQPICEYAAGLMWASHTGCGLHWERGAQRAFTLALGRGNRGIERLAWVERSPALAPHLPVPFAGDSRHD